MIYIVHKRLNHKEKKHFYLHHCICSTLLGSFSSPWRRNRCCIRDKLRHEQLCYIHGSKLGSTGEINRIIRLSGFRWNQQGSEVSVKLVHQWSRHTFHSSVSFQIFQNEWADRFLQRGGMFGFIKGTCWLGGVHASVQKMNRATSFSFLKVALHLFNL